MPRYGVNDLGRYVPGEGNPNATIMLVGESPGKDEDRIGRPFVGKSGRFLDTMLRRCLSLDRSEVWITNLVKRHPPGDADPTEEIVRLFEKDLEKELAEVRPSIVCSLGRHSSRWFLGDISMEVSHGIPRWSDRAQAVVLPAYHPAAGLHNTALQGIVAWDFQQLRLLMDGQLEVGAAQDEYPEPDYAEFQEKSTVTKAKQVFLDTEGSVEKPWSYQISTRPGMARMRRHPHKLRIEGTRIIGHNISHDLSVLRAMGVDPENLDIGDTMLMASLLCIEPQGLKPLAERLCGAEQTTYINLMREPNRKLALAWLEEAYTWVSKHSTNGSNESSSTRE